MFQPKRSRFRKLRPEIARRTIKQSFFEGVASDGYNRGPMADFEAPEIYDPAPAPSDDDFRWPMTIEEFQERDFLEPGDVLLTTKLKSFFSYLVRSLDNGAFAHAALVFLTPKHRVGVDGAYFLETTFRGVGLEGFSKIVSPSKRRRETSGAPRYVVGVKRLETPWITPPMRNMVAGRMLRFINDDNYNFSLLAALATPAPGFWFWLRDAVFGRSPTVRQYTKKRFRFAPTEFICSGFVQYAYVDMVRFSVKQELLKQAQVEKAWDDVFFADWVSPDTSMEDLIAVKPAELADSSKLAWKYLIFDGMAHRVRNNQEAVALLKRFEAESEN
jgi:hypothetical protein